MLPVFPIKLHFARNGPTSVCWHEDPDWEILFSKKQMPRNPARSRHPDPAHKTAPASLPVDKSPTVSLAYWLSDTIFYCADDSNRCILTTLHQTDCLHTPSHQTFCLLYRLHLHLHTMQLLILRSNLPVPELLFPQNPSCTFHGKSHLFSCKLKKVGRRNAELPFLRLFVSFQPLSVLLAQLCLQFYNLLLVLCCLFF